MAARRDELSAYTFAKKRTLAAFLRPSPAGTDEGAPAPLRAVVPGLVTAALLLAGFGAWGMLAPKAPKGWDAPGTHVVVGKQSTTRYVVLTTGHGENRRTLLHPVLNLASARLLLDPHAFDVVYVDDEVLDAGRPPRGPILGIPYAPDRLPAPDEAGRAKRWAVCAQPGGGGARGTVQKAAFVLAERDFGRTEGQDRRLAPGEVLYVKGQKGALRYLVDDTGTKYPLPGPSGDADHLATVLVGVDREPQSVTDDWLATLHTGSPVDFPALPGRTGAPAGVGGGLSPTEDRVGMVLRSGTGAGPQHYVVLPGEVRPVSDFTAWLLINSPQAQPLDMDGRPTEVGAADFPPGATAFGAELRWPKSRVRQVNGADGEGARDTVCSVLRAVDAQGRTTLSVWAGPEYPAEITPAGPATYVTPGSGVLTSSDGTLHLVTDTGLRYAVRREAQIRLGYEDVTPVRVPAAWSDFLSKGPRLDTDGARRPQGS
ncbi:type VII secretion protein EccB [Streptomyces sp. NPDC048604]|uniref:type VII secretion protein EccB n=1 Tax=Streptomyces sp. NPDC048604 TaxID=3365578 RepID=UPI00371C55B9